MLHLARTGRPRRPGEWSEAKAVTFIVTLAASRSVTLAAARSGMSRKSAYALRRRDPAFAAAWDEAFSAAVSARRQPARKPVRGNKGDEVDDPPVKRRQGNNPSPPWLDPFDAAMRDILLAAVANRPEKQPSARLAREAALP